MAIVSTSPQNPDHVLLSVDATSGAQVRAAVQRARVAQRSWASLAPAQRAAALEQCADAVAAAGAELTELMVAEVGKPAAEAAGELARCVAILRYYAQQVFDPIGSVHTPSSGSGMLSTQRRPRGVAGLITPWNFPLAIPLWKAAPALASGNAVLLKPAPQASACGVRLGHLLTEVLPDDLFAVVPGLAETGRALVESVDVVSFTGSTVAGIEVALAATRRPVPVQCEMGGHNPALVLADADPQAAAQAIVHAAFDFAGQKCTATKRIIVVGDNPAFSDALIEVARTVRVGDPGAEGVTVGPVIDEAARERVTAAAESACARGARLLARVEAPGSAGWYAAPSLLTDVPADHALATTEVFGPIATVTNVSSIDEAVQLANASRYALTASVFTRDLDHALEVSGRLASGQVKVNQPSTGVDFYVPFGGEQSSSIGSREQGKAAVEFYSALHTVTIGRAGPVA